MRSCALPVSLQSIYGIALYDFTPQLGNIQSVLDFVVFITYMYAYLICTFLLHMPTSEGELNGIKIVPMKPTSEHVWFEHILLNVLSKGLGKSSKTYFASPYTCI